jgi:hypothetical protein
VTFVRNRIRRVPMRAVLLLVASLATVAEAQNATPPRDAGRAAQPAAGRIRGRVVAADTGQPLGRAQVSLGGVPTGSRRTLTDADGRYEFADLPAGTFVVSVSKTGYVTLQFGQRRPFEPGRPVAVAEGRTADRVDVALPRGGVIAVRVNDDLGFPIAGVDVRAQRFEYRPDGQRTLATVYGAIQGPMATDDRGEIRLFGLMPGEYVITAVIRFFSAPGTSVSTPVEAYAPTFYPGVSSASQATPITVRIGEETAAQFSLVRSRLARVSGILLDPDGRPANGGRVALVAGSPALPYSGPNVGPDGRFLIADVPPGEYHVVVTFSTIEEIWGTLAIAGDDLPDLRITVNPGVAVTGRLVFEGGAPARAQVSPFRIVLAAANPVAVPGFTFGQATTTPDDDGRFGFGSVSGRIIIGVTSPDGWMMKSIAVAGDDFTHAPIDLAGRTSLSNVVITMTSKLTTVSGQVADVRGQSVRDYAVVIVPAEAYEIGITNRRVRTLRAGPEGTFTTRGMMPGRYVAVAVEAVEEGRQFSPEFQQQVRRAGQEFSLREGETATLNLRLTPDF